MLWKILNILLLLTLSKSTATTTTTPYCPENLTKVELLPVLRSHIITLPSVGLFNRFVKQNSITITYFEYQKKLSFKLLNKCCLGYRMTLYGICEPVCEKVHCDPNEHQLCIEPERCACENGYESMDVNSIHCEPICENGCQLNAYCRTPNICDCLANFTLNFKSNKCEARCRPGIEWDAQTMTCVQKFQANVAVVAAETVEMVSNAAPANIDHYEGAGDGDPAAFVGIAQKQSISDTLDGCTHESDEKCGGKRWPNCLYISIGIGVALLLVTLVLAGRYAWKKRHSVERIVILEPKHDFYDDYGLERNQILVY